MSAKVTNTGKVAGADVAQLYLGDPAVAAEPPRQLKGFDRVNLAPGASTTVQFTLNGHDLSYFNETANGWVVPDGRFNVFVGDSSALDEPAAARRLHRRADRGSSVRHAVGADHDRRRQHRHGQRHARQRRRLRATSGSVQARRARRLDVEQPRSGDDRGR